MARLSAKPIALAAMWFILSAVVWVGILQVLAPHSTSSCPETGRSEGLQLKPEEATEPARTEVDDCVVEWEENIKEKYSILSPFKGHIDYATFFNHYRTSKFLDRLIVVWANDEEPPDWSEFPWVETIVQSRDSLVQREKGALPIDFSLNNRFRPYECIRTEAVFSLDNDMLIPTEYMDFVFATWQMFPRHIVGFSARLARPSETEPYVGKYEIHWSQWSAFHVKGHTLEYNLVYTNAAMFHRELLNDYTCRAPQVIRDMVAKIRSCEDIALNIIAYKKWENLPLAVVSQTKCVDNYGVAQQIKRDTPGLAKKGDEDTYDLFRGKCYRRICDWMNVTDIPQSTVAIKAFDDQVRCKHPRKK